MNIPAQSGSTAAIPASSQPDPTPTMLGKRHRDSTSSNVTGVIEDRDSAKKREKDLARIVLRPSKKRTRLEGGGEMPGPSPESNKSPSSAPTPSMVPSDCESTSAPSGTSTTSSSRIPSAGTPPPLAHLPEFFGESLDEHVMQRKDADIGINPADFDMTGTNFARAFGMDGYFPFSFTAGAATSTPRVDGGMGGLDLFDPDVEPFSPGSALSAQHHHETALPTFNPFGSRRIPSRTFPRTPTQEINRLGEVQAMEETQMPHPGSMLASPVTGLSDDMFVTDRLAFDFHHDPATPQYQTTAVANSNGTASSQLMTPTAESGQYRQHYRQQQQFVPGVVQRSSAGIHLNAGASYSGRITETPMRQTTRTLYGTELVGDRRFGDFGREGIIGANTADVWLASVFQQQ